MVKVNALGMIHLSVKIKEEHRNALFALAEANGVTVSDIVRPVIADFLAATDAGMPCTPEQPEKKPVEPTPARDGLTNEDRADVMRADIQRGCTYSALGAVWGMTRQRVHQIVNRCPRPRKPNGAFTKPTEPLVKPAGPPPYTAGDVCICAGFECEVISIDEAPGPDGEWKVKLRTEDGDELDATTLSIRAFPNVTSES
jgi:hypothetical protein